MRAGCAATAWTWSDGVNVVDAFHSVWSAPSLSPHAHPAAACFTMEDFELLTMLLSALEWRRHNGRIRLVTDRAGAAFFAALGLGHVWDLGVSPLPEPEVDPFLFWAAGKLAALRAQKAPVVMIDTDFIVWEALPAFEEPIAVIHREALEPSVYPPLSVFRMEEGYTPDPQWDYQEEACNTALCIIRNEAFKDAYTAAAFDFMRNLREGANRVTGMVYAEQRIISMCARARGFPIRALSTLDGLRPGRQTRFTHLWGYKDVLRRDTAEREVFCRRCAARIVRDFPQERDTLWRIPALARYCP